MTKRSYESILLGSVLAFATTVPSMAEEEALEAPIEDARSCLTTRSFRKTTVVDDLNILFYTTGRKIYRNILPRQCNGLARNGRFSYTTLSGSLCNFDTIRVMDDRGMHGRSCRLGSFYRVTEADIAVLYGAQNKPIVTTAPAPAEVEEISPAPKDSGESENQ